MKKILLCTLLLLMFVHLSGCQVQTKPAAIPMRLNLPQPPEQWGNIYGYSEQSQLWFNLAKLTAEVQELKNQKTPVQGEVK